LKANREVDELGTYIGIRKRKHTTFFNNDVAYFFVMTNSTVVESS